MGDCCAYRTVSGRGGGFRISEAEEHLSRGLGSARLGGDGNAVVILVGKMLLKGARNKSFQLHEQGEENCLLAVGAALPTAADYAIQQKHGELLWNRFRFWRRDRFVLCNFCRKLCECGDESK
jgi:hypothetical protein